MRTMDSRRQRADLYLTALAPSKRSKHDPDLPSPKERLPLREVRVLAGKE